MMVAASAVLKEGDAGANYYEKYSPRGENPPRGEAVLCLGFRNSRRRVGGEFWEFPKTRPDKPPQFPKLPKIHVR